MAVFTNLCSTINVIALRPFLSLPLRQVPPFLSLTVRHFSRARPNIKASLIESPAPPPQQTKLPSSGQNKDGKPDWKNLTVVMQSLRFIMREQKLNSPPSSKFLKENGFAELLMAIRKKHGGVGNVALKMGFEPPNAKAAKKRIQNLAREARRQKRHTKLTKVHRVFK